MKELSIVTSGNVDTVKDRLLLQLSSEIASELSVSVEQNALNVQINDETQQKNVAKVLADAIIENYEKKLIYKIILDNYFYFNNFEKRSIFKNTFKYISDDRTEGGDFFKNREQIINGKMLEYLDTNDKIVLDGFVNFRLKDYVLDLEEIVDKAVDDFLVEKEYREFIKLLKYFVDIQQTKEEKVHVVVGGSTKYRILNSDMVDITGQCHRDFFYDTNTFDINYDDLLVSSLITLAPLKIYVHYEEDIENKELMTTIKSVFTKRITECEGCGLCRGDA